MFAFLKYFVFLTFVIEEFYFNMIIPQTFRRKMATGWVKLYVIYHGNLWCSMWCMEFPYVNGSSIWQIILDTPENRTEDIPEPCVACRNGR